MRGLEIVFFILLISDPVDLQQKSRHIPISPPRAADFQRPIAPPFSPDQSRSNCLAVVLTDSGTCCCPCFSRSSLSSFAEIRAGRLTPVAGV
ncbi:hypothetical protein V6N12_030858 [Hibiscus sabdariffa]|uniref:Secreted protein n=1 Tax=Hibiscus sabdariffa TaxID=183260 RepID=A0ABR2E8Q7_9ROSI